jgi:cytochrome c-type protein NapB
MSPRPADDAGFSRFNIVRALVLMVLLVVVVGVTLEESSAERSAPELVPSGSALQPVASEAGVYRLGMGDFAIAPDYVEDRGAHPRFMEMYRRLRAYPGAPPRVPHGLTEEEYRRESCNTCHERGGWVTRLGAFAPVTPHPEQGSCLQCHVPRDELVGVPLPEPGAAMVCDQCHLDPDRQPETFVASDWVSTTWPTTDIQAMEGSPHVIPHSVESRNNCLACHAGPAAIASIRVDHPERTNCRQCHVSAVQDDAGVRPGGIGEEREGPGGGA